jgi:hypothetical protein
MHLFVIQARKHKVQQARSSARSVRKCLRNTGDVRGNYLIIQVAGILLHIGGVSTVLETDVVITYQSIRIGLTACIETIRC